MEIRTLIRGVILLLSILGIIGCENSTKDSKVEATTTDVKTEIVSEVQLERYLDSIGKTHSTESERQVLLAKYSDDSLIAEVAAEKGFLEDPEIQTKLETYKRKLLSQTLLTHELNKRYTDDVLKNEYVSNIDQFSDRYFALKQYSVSDISKLQLEELMKNYGTDDKLLIYLQSNNVSFLFTLVELKAEDSMDIFGLEIEPKEGDVLGPIPFGDGLILAEVLRTKITRAEPFEKVKRMLLERKRADFRDQYIQELRTSGKLTLQ